MKIIIEADASEAAKAEQARTIITRRCPHISGLVEVRTPNASAIEIMDISTGKTETFVGKPRGFGHPDD